MPPTRLQKILSAAGISSRRASETLITEGRVTVNGQPVTELGSKADPDQDDIRVDGRRVKTAASRRYILMYKPRGYITSRSDPEQRPTVIDLLNKGGVREYVYPVGRLDYESEGLLLLTSDGALAEKLMHPSHGVAREYHARVRGVPDRHALERLARGVVLDGRKTAPAEIQVLRRMEGPGGDDAVLSIVIHEGRNRQVRRMCEAVGHPVLKLRRVRIGPIHDEHIRPGEFRDLSDREVAALKRAAEKGDSHRFPRFPAKNRDSHRFSEKGDSPIAEGKRQKSTPNRRFGKTGTAPVSRKTVAVPVSGGKTVAAPISRSGRAPRNGPGPRPRGPRPSGRPRRG